MEKFKSTRIQPDINILTINYAKPLPEEAEVGYKHIRSHRRNYFLQVTESSENN